MFRDWRTGVTALVVVAGVFILGVAIGHTVANDGVKVVRWCSWSRGGESRSGYEHGSDPVRIERNGVVFDCIPQVRPSDLGTDNILVTSKLRLQAEHYRREAKRLDQLATKLWEMMKLPELKAAGAYSRAEAALNTKWAEKAEAKAAKKEGDRAGQAVPD